MIEIHHLIGFYLQNSGFSGLNLKNETPSEIYCS